VCGSIMRDVRSLILNNGDWGFSSLPGHARARMSIVFKFGSYLFNNNMSRGHRKPLGQHLISIMQNSSRNIIIMHSIGGFRNKMRVIFLDILEADDATWQFMRPSWLLILKPPPIAANSFKQLSSLLLCAGSKL
jgi:hypothetical protein